MFRCFVQCFNIEFVCVSSSSEYRKRIRRAVASSFQLCSAASVAVGVEADPVRSVQFFKFLVNELVNISLLMNLPLLQVLENSSSQRA